MEIKVLQSIIKEFEKSSLMTIEVETKEYKIRLSKNKHDGAIFTDYSKNSTNQAVEQQINLPEYIIKAPLVGTFYLQADPEKAPFIEVGNVINVGDTIGIIEAMKIMNEIKSDVSGVVEEILVTNGSIVGFDDILVRVKKNANTE